MTDLVTRYDDLCFFFYVAIVIISTPPNPPILLAISVLIPIIAFLPLSDLPFSHFPHEFLLRAAGAVFSIPRSRTRSIRRADSLRLLPAGMSLPLPAAADVGQ